VLLVPPLGGQTLILLVNRGKLWEEVVMEIILWEAH
jgi:hypothetical protein